MKILGIIVEYNPFHTGHLYHLQKAKEMVKPDLTIAIMSGNYVQRGEVAIIDKFKRSELAIKYGVDLVIELPFAYVCQSADYFCKGAIDLLYHIGITDLVFGSECGDIHLFKEIAYAIKNNPADYDQYVKNAMKQGLRYPDACNQALSLLLNKSIQTPNDLLGLGYVKEVINHDYPICLHCIQRSNDYHDTSLTKIASATALRKALKEKQDVHDYLLDMSYYDHLYDYLKFYRFLLIEERDIFHIPLQRLQPSRCKFLHLILADRTSVKNRLINTHNRSPLPLMPDDRSPDPAKLSIPFFHPLRSAPHQFSLEDGLTRSAPQLITRNFQFRKFPFMKRNLPTL